MSLNLLEKTELWINNIKLNGVNLTSLAEKVALVLNLPSDKVMVVDVRPEHITLDILEKNIPEVNIIGKQGAILDALKSIDGVQLTEESFIHSNGILGLICLEEENAPELVEKIKLMTDEISSKIATRAIVFPTGFELQESLIEDTNTPFLQSFLINNGYTVSFGNALPDDLYTMTASLSEAVSKAYGLIITTGGVGAEDKDKSVESVLKLDPTASTPYVVKFEKGSGRHVKDGVRIAVGQVGPSLIVALPGPHDEVQLVAPVLLCALNSKCNKNEIAKRIADILAKKWIDDINPKNQKHNHSK